MTTELAKNGNNNVILPAVTGDEALKIWKLYQDLIVKICDDNDYQMIEGKRFRKKSGWRKIARFFNLSVEEVSSCHETIGRTFAWHFSMKAIAPNGQYATGVGSCDAYEKATKVNGGYKRWNKYKKQWEDAKPNSIHNIRSTAETRAYNRAISNLIGGGEVSADEIVDTNEIDDELNVAPHESEATQSIQEPPRLLCTNIEIHGLIKQEIKQEVAQYSEKRFGRMLCLQCQTFERGKKE